MRAVIQRVVKSSVRIEDEEISSIQRGLLVLFGVGNEDDEEDLEYIYNKIINLRIFEDENEKMNKSLLDIKGDILLVSQFTLYGDARRGRRPSFTDSADPTIAERYYKDILKKLRETENINMVESGVFGGDMQIELINDGPVTILLDSKKQF